MSDLETISTTIGKCDLFSRVDEAGVSAIAEIAHLKKVQKGEILFRQGDPCTSMYLVAQGLGRLYQLAPSGKEHTLHLAMPGQSFAEIAAMDQKPYPASAQAMEASILVAIDAHRLAELLQSNHQLCYQMTLSMARWMRRTIGLLEDVVLRDALGRVANYLLANAETDMITLPTKQAHLATHLNLTPETLSRSLRRLGESEIIRSSGKKVTLLNREALEAIREGM